MALRRAGPGDLEPLVEMAAEYVAMEGHAVDRERLRRGFQPLLTSDDHGVVWIIEDAASVVGYAVVTWGWSIESGGRDALLDEIYVRRRGRGVGAGALSEILGDLERRGIRRVFLETEAGNEAARRLYARHGFRVEDSVWMSRES